MVPYWLSVKKSTGTLATEVHEEDDLIVYQKRRKAQWPGVLALGLIGRVAHQPQGLVAIDKYGVEQKHPGIMFLFLKSEDGGFGRLQAGRDGAVRPGPGNKSAAVIFQRIEMGFDGFIRMMIPRAYTDEIGGPTITVLQINVLVGAAVSLFHTSNASYDWRACRRIHLHRCSFRHRFPLWAHKEIVEGYYLAQRMPVNGIRRNIP